MSESLAIAAPAKVNLCLRVVGRRADGYHLLQSLVVFVDLCDRIDVVAAPVWRLTVRGPFAAAVPADDNLVVRAGRLLAGLAAEDVASCAALAASIALEKNIPVAAGLGGGSADAAAVLHALNRLWRLDLSLEALQAAAGRLGADLPACLAGHPAWVAGIGETVEAAPPLPDMALLLVNPGIPLATADVFRRLTPPYSLPATLPDSGGDLEALSAALEEIGNDLLGPARALCPTIGTVLADLRDLEHCLLAQMSGSGATCFGIFAGIEHASAAAAQMRARRPGWFVHPCRVAKPR